MHTTLRFAIGNKSRALMIAKDVIAPPPQPIKYEPNELKPSSKSYKIKFFSITIFTPK